MMFTEYNKVVNSTRVEWSSYSPYCLQ